MTKEWKHVDVVVALVNDEHHRFFVCFNSRWGQYGFPMTKARQGVPADESAIQALRDHVPPSVLKPDAVPTAQPLECLGAYGPSFGAGEDTYYDYHVFAVDPGQDLPGGAFAAWCGFLEYESLRHSPVVTWSTKEITQALVEYQEAVVSVITRPGPSGKQFLLVEKPSHGGLFFPVARLKADANPDDVAKEALISNTGWLGPAEVIGASEAEIRQFNPRYDRERTFQFHLRAVGFPSDVDLTAMDSELESAMASSGVRWGWLTENELLSGDSHSLSPAVELVRNQVIQVALATE